MERGVNVSRRLARFIDYFGQMSANPLLDTNFLRYTFFL
jgi:hypothetical protein